MWHVEVTSYTTLCETDKSNVREKLENVVLNCCKLHAHLSLIKVMWLRRHNCLLHFCKYNIFCGCLVNKKNLLVISFKAADAFLLTYAL